MPKGVYPRLRRYSAQQLAAASSESAAVLERRLRNRSQGVGVASDPHNGTMGHFERFLAEQRERINRVGDAQLGRFLERRRRLDLKRVDRASGGDGLGELRVTCRGQVGSDVHDGGGDD